MSDPREKFAGCPVTVREGHFDASTVQASLFYYREGSKGVCSNILPNDSSRVFVTFNDDETWIALGCNGGFEVKAGYAKPKTWSVPIEALDFSLSFFDNPYYKPGANGWIPDRLADGIDVMKVTADLVSQEVGK